MSILKINGVQIGQSLTAANNFTWYQPATPDGTVRFGNGNAGSVTDILTVDKFGNISSSNTITAPSFSGPITGSGAGLTSIPNGALVNSSLTINGTAISLGGSGTVTAAAGTLTGTTLNSVVTGSSLTSVGTITSGTWSGSFGAVSGANLTGLTAGNLSGTIPSAVLGNSTHYVGTTAITLNRASGIQTLSGVSIDGNSGSTSSVAWGNVSGKPTTVDGYGIINALVRGGPIGSIDFNAQRTLASGIYSVGASPTNGPALSAYSNFIQMYERADTAAQLVIEYSTGRMFSRGIQTAIPTYSNWRTQIDDGNYNSYAMPIGSSATNSVDIRAPIFYDSNDTGYYINPNDTTNMYKVISYQGAKYSTSDWADGFRNTPTSGRCFHGDISAGGPTGTWWFYDSMRHSNSSNYWGTQLAYGWEDNANQLYQRNISSNSFSGWVKYWNTGHQLQSTVFYDANDTGYYIDPNSTGNTALRIRGGALHGPNPSWGAYLYVGTNGNVDVNTATVTATNGNLHIDAANGYQIYLNNYATSSYTIVAQSCRSPIFYDSDNTGYYLDPNSVSRLYSTNNNIYYTYGVGGDSGVGNQSYAIYQQGGAWGHPYPDLAIGYHTGIKIGAYLGYNGTRFYNNSDFATIIASIGDGDNALRSYDNIIAYASDKRLKENIIYIENPIDKVKKLNGVYFDWKDFVEELGFCPSKKHEVGLLAQDVEEVLPEAVEIAPFDYDWEKEGKSKSGEKYLTVKYEKIVPLLIEAIKEQQLKIEHLEKLIYEKI